jgi:hypothetical protein
MALTVVSAALTIGEGSLTMMDVSLTVVGITPTMVFVVQFRLRQSCNADICASQGKFYCTREYHSFKKAHVDANLSFDNGGAESDPLHEDVKSKTQFDMKTPVRSKEDPFSKKGQ